MQQVRLKKMVRVLLDCFLVKFQRKVNGDLELWSEGVESALFLSFTLTLSFDLHHKSVLIGQ